MEVIPIFYKTKIITIENIQVKKKLYLMEQLPP